MELAVASLTLTYRHGLYVCQSLARRTLMLEIEGSGTDLDKILSSVDSLTVAVNRD